MWPFKVSLEKIRKWESNGNSLKLISALRKEDSGLREQACESLVRLGDRAVDDLIAALDTHEKSIQKQIVDALGSIGNPRAVEPICALIRQEKLDYQLLWKLIEFGEHTLSPAIDLLKHNNQEIRWTAASVLRELALPAAQNALLNALEDDYALVRKQAAGALIKLGDASCVDTLIRALDDEFDGVRCSAAEALGAIGDARAVNPLIRLLYADQYQSSIVAAKALGNFNTPEVIEALISTIRRDKAVGGNAAAESLGRIGAPKAVKPLVMCIWSGGLNKTAGIKALCKIFDAESERSSGTAGEEILSEQILEEIDDHEAAQALANSLSIKCEDKTRYGALYQKYYKKTESLLLALKGKSLLPLINAGKDHEAENRVFPLIRELIRNRIDINPVALIISSLGDIYPEARTHLGEILDLPAVKSKFEHVDDQTVATFVRFAFSNECMPSDMPILKIITERLGSKIVEPLTQKLSIKKHSTRIKASKLLGNVPGPQSVQALLDILRDKEKRYSKKDTTNLRRTILHSLEKTKDKNAVEPIIEILRHDDELKRDAIEALGALGDNRAVEPLIEILRHDDELKRDAIKSLGALGDSRAVEPLIEMLDGERDVRYAAAKSLGWIGDKKAVMPLLAKLDDPYFNRKECLSALGDIGDPGTIEPIIQRLREDDKKRRFEGCNFRDKRAEAECLRKIYEQNDLDEKHKKLILEQKDVVVYTHHKDSRDCSGHHDQVMDREYFNI